MRVALALIIGTVSGLVFGLLLFLLSTLSGFALFLTTGAVAGFALGLLFLAYSSRLDNLSLSELTISVPEFAEIKFITNSESRILAWKLFVETLTRISTQPLSSDSGSLRDGLSSLYSLFTNARTLLKESHPSRHVSGITVEVFAARMLNQELRPFLSKWHIRFETNGTTGDQSQAELDVALAKECRNELEILRGRIVRYTRAFAELAELHNVDHFFVPGTQTTLP